MSSEREKEASFTSCNEDFKVCFLSVRLLKVSLTLMFLQLALHTFLLNPRPGHVHQSSLSKEAASASLSESCLQPGRGSEAAVGGIVLCVCVFSPYLSASVCCVEKRAAFVCVCVLTESR